MAAILSDALNDTCTNTDTPKDIENQPVITPTEGDKAEIKKTNELKRALIISLRGSHLDRFPASNISSAIKYLSTKHPELPITVCFESDPTSKTDDSRLNELIKNYHHKIDQGISAFHNQPYSFDEEEHDKSIWNLLRLVRLRKINFIATDLPGISCIPLGNSRAQELRPAREDAMCSKLIQAANQFGGIIFDIGGFDHVTNLQKNLEKCDEVRKQQHEVHFYCAYGPDGQKYMPLDIRLMQFTGVKAQQFPLGLKFLTVSDAITAKSTRSAILDAEEQVQTQFHAGIEQLIAQRSKKNAMNASTISNASVGAGAAAPSAGPGPGPGTHQNQPLIFNAMIPEPVVAVVDSAAASAALSAVAATKALA